MRLRALPQVVLASGDALVFGGNARDMVHSVPRLHPSNATDDSRSGTAANSRGLIELLAPAEQRTLASLIGRLSPTSTPGSLAFRINFNFRKK